MQLKILCPVDFSDGEMNEIEIIAKEMNILPEELLKKAALNGCKILKSKGAV